MSEQRMKMVQVGTSKQWVNESGQRHREDGPAVIEPDGRLSWYRNGKLHREGGEPAVYHEGVKWEWYVDGKLHREDGPSVVDSTEQIWYRNGKRHRENGPAVVKWDGRKEYWFNNKRYWNVESDYDWMLFQELGFTDEVAFSVS